jgi:hypothetical protein
LIRHGFAAAARSGLGEIRPFEAVTRATRDDNAGPARIDAGTDRLAIAPA